MRLPRGLYASLILVPLLILGLGIFSNQLVLFANHDRFPVMLNQTKLSRFVEKEDKPTLPFGFDSRIRYEESATTPIDLGPEGMIDLVHCVMVPDSRLKPLADVWDLGSTIFSVGDFMIMLGSWLLNFTPIMWLALILRK